MDVYVDASTLIALGTVGELDCLAVLDGTSVVPESVLEEVTTEPAGTNVERFCDRDDVRVGRISSVGDTELSEARRILGEEEVNGDVHIVAEVRSRKERDVGVVSDDRRVRTTTRELGATVTGTIGVVVRTVEDGELSREFGKELVRRIDGRGLHMTGELRETAYELIDEAADER